MEIPNYVCTRQEALGGVCTSTAKLAKGEAALSAYDHNCCSCGRSFFTLRRRKDARTHAIADVWETPLPINATFSVNLTRILAAAARKRLRPTPVFIFKKI